MHMKQPANSRDAKLSTKRDTTARIGPGCSCVPFKTNAMSSFLQLPDSSFQKPAGPVNSRDAKLFTKRDNTDSEVADTVNSFYTAWRIYFKKPRKIKGLEAFVHRGGGGFDGIIKTARTAGV